jgi:hypothetical protein
MRHGRDHQQREPHIRLRRTRNTPEADSFETKLLTSGRKRGKPPEGLVGAHRQRREPTRELMTSSDREREPVGPGSDVAPTEKATRREQERHRREREIGRVAAGTERNLRDRRSRGVTREKLEAAARGADEAVGKKRPRAATAGAGKKRPRSKR